MSEARDRIEASRASLRLAMTPPPPALPHESAARSDSWLHKIGALPLIHAVIESVESWWSHHPLRPVADVASEASNAIVKPVAQRNPLALVLVAALVGAGVAWTRPWRWIFRSALFAGLVPQLASRVVSNLPIESWMTMVGSALSASRPSATNPSREVAPDAPAA